ncbi:uncharacterized protein LOC141595334 [Silene latifolia]|uniref:uncharacterized protein LOC141595334 n=1 Tax=Silene latifolia TaxID=37657 RepID=UPI003D77A407
MGSRVDNAVNKGGAPYCYRLGGQNHHSIGSLLPPVGKQPLFMKLYFQDTENELTNRVTSLSGEGKNNLQPDIVESLSQMMYEHNDIAKFCKMARERMSDVDLEPVQLRLRAGRSKDDRQSNPPTGDEFVAHIIGCRETEKGAQDIVIQERTSGLQRISELHPKFMAMQYPLIFPYGEDGYRLRREHLDASTTSRKKRKTVTMREYYAYRFQERWKDGELTDGICVVCGRLRQQFMCDAFTCVEETRLDYVRHNQKTIRKYSLCGLTDAVAAGEVTPTSIGQRIILPPSYPNCFRNLFQLYQDGLAICRWTGPPDLFITFTCNPKWEEISEFLKSIPGQRPEDHPDILARVFKINLDELMLDLTKRAFFGETLAVELQKRGFPHTHICLFLRPESKQTDPSYIDKIISAKLLDKAKDPTGYEAVVKYGREAEKNKHTLDNRSVVHHNLDLLVKYQAHLNVEWCNKHKSVKYLFKYMSKGPDMAHANVQEVRHNIQYKQPPVQRLTYHLETEQDVFFDDSEAPDDVLNRVGDARTTLTEWMTTNQKHEDTCL